MDLVPMLVCTEGAMKGRKATVSATGILVGRDPECEMCIEDPGVSRQHARLVLHNAGVWVQDAGSRNGVFVNERRVVRPKQMSPGDTLAVGEHRFALELVPPERQPVDLEAPTEKIYARIYAAGNNRLWILAGTVLGVLVVLFIASLFLHL